MIDPSSDEIEWVPFGSIATVRSGFAFKSTDWIDAGVPVVKITNLRGNRLNLDGCSFVSVETARSAGEFNLQRHDVLIAMTGDNVGDVAIVEDAVAGVVNQRVGLIRPVQGRIGPRLLYHLLRLPRIRTEIQVRAVGSVQANIGASAILDLLVPLPPPQDRDRIEIALTSIDARIRLANETAKTLEDLAATITQCSVDSRHDQVTSTTEESV